MKKFDHARLLIDAFLLLVAIVCASAFAYQSQHTLPATLEDIAMCREAGDCTSISIKAFEEVVGGMMSGAAQSGFMAGRKSCERGAMTL